MHLLLLAFLYIANLSELSRAVNINVQNAFQWGFTDHNLSTSLPQCSNISISVMSDTNDTTALGAAPYYLIAFELGGPATTSLIGSNPNALTWQVNHRAGSQLLLSIADANGNAGGVEGQIYTVAPGQTTSCMPPSPTGTLGIAANVTTNLTTCDPWGLTVYGGVEPYTITLAQPNSNVVTNVTLGLEEDVMTYINRANPNELLLAVVSDATGQFGVNSSTVYTQGAAINNQSCGSLVTTSGNSTEMHQSAQTAQGSKRTHRRTITIIAVCVVIGVIAIVSVIGFFLYRRYRWVFGNNEKADVTPRAFDSHLFLRTGSPPLQSQLDAPQNKSPLFQNMPSLVEISSSASTPRAAYPWELHWANLSPEPLQIDDRPPRHNARHVRSAHSLGDLGRAALKTPTLPTATHALHSRSASATILPIPSMHNGPSSPEYPGNEVGTQLYQHHDAGRITEIPPPYIDYS